MGITDSRHASARVADVLRVLVLVSALVTLAGRPTEVALRFALVFGLLLVTRTLDLPRPFDAAFAAMLLASGWANALDWYHERPWIDIPIHFALTGATAAMLYFVLARHDLLPRPEQPTVRKSVAAIVLITALVGAGAAVLWEIYEWLVASYVDSRIPVGYDDTIGDMANGAVGSLVAGLALAAWQRHGHGLGARA